MVVIHIHIEYRKNDLIINLSFTQKTNAQTGNTNNIASMGSQTNS